MANGSVLGGGAGFLAPEFLLGFAERLLDSMSISYFTKFVHLENTVLADSFAAF